MKNYTEILENIREEVLNEIREILSSKPLGEQIVVFYNFETQGGFEEEENIETIFNLPSTFYVDKYGTHIVYYITSVFIEDEDGAIEMYGYSFDEEPGEMSFNEEDFSLSSLVYILNSMRS